MISWTERMINEEVVRLVEEERCMLEVIVKRKKAWLGHVVRGEGL